MKIGICTPCYDGTVHNEHMISAIQTDRLARERGFEILFFTGPGNANLPKVRNILAATALDAGCEWIVFIDADIAWKPADLFKAISHGKDLVAAGPAKRHNRWDEKPAAVAKFPASGETVGIKTPAGILWKVEGAATAFMAIHQSVFYKMTGTTIRHFAEGIEVRTWFWFDLIAKNGGDLEAEGEDYHFCRKYREAGGDVWLDPEIRLRHYSGTVCHDLCFADGEK